MDIDVDVIESGAQLILSGLGYKDDNNSLKQTPLRYAKALMEMCTREEFNLTEFEDGNYTGLVFQGPIPFHSLCEHHILPFYGDVWIGYIPNGKIVGLSKLARTVDYWSKGLNTQEYITQNIANFLQEKLNPLGVAVRMTGVHMCMELRGVKKSGVPTTTQTFLGAFFDEPQTRLEFENLVRDNQ